MKAELEEVYGNLALSAQIFQKTKTAQKAKY